MPMKSDLKGEEMKNTFLLVFVMGLFFFSFAPAVLSVDVNDPNVIFENDAIKIWTQWQHDKIAYDSNSSLAINFETGDKWHFYSDAETAPAPNLYLQLEIVGETKLKFREAIFPQPVDYFDKTQDKNVKVYGGSFTVYVPFKAISKDVMQIKDMAAPVVEINGAYCSDFQCRVIMETFDLQIPDFAEQSGDKNFDLPQKTSPPTETQSSDGDIVGGFGIVTLSKFALAVITGLLFNVMPCVLPVIPLIITKLLKQSEQSKARSLGLGGIFCVGIISFFALIAIVNIVLKIGFGTVLQWGDYFRYPWFIQGMSLLLIALGLFMFGVFSIGIPSSVTGKASSGEGAAGSFGMGFLAALLSTPCSFGILAGVVAWAQTQNLFISTMVFLLMGIGMALPYAVLISFPALLKKIPKPGDWMERIKIAMGFVLIVIAIKLFEALSPDKLIVTLYYAIVLSFALWMWGGWVDYKTKKGKKIIVRLLALVVAVIGGFMLLGNQTGDLVDWQKYDGEKIKQAIENDQPVLVKFTADWCATCKVVDKNVYQKQDVADMIQKKGILAIKGDTTTNDLPATDALKNIYNEPGVPVTVVHLPGVEKPIKLRGVINKSDLTKILDRLE